MNEREELVKLFLENKGHKVKKMNFRYPDFLVDDSFFVEVKNADLMVKGIGCLSDNQHIFFRELDKPIKIFYVIEKRYIRVKQYEPDFNINNRTINLHITFTDEEHEELTKKKGNLSWHDFILELIKEVTQ
jgi:hypothetical protein